MRNPYQPPGVTAERRRRAPDPTSRIAATAWQSQPDSPGRSWTVRAASWLCSAIVEGFALYGQSVYPCAIDPREAHPVRAEKALRPASTASPQRENPWLPTGRSSHDIDIHAWLTGVSSHPQQNTRRRFRLAAVLPYRRTGRASRWSREPLDVPYDRLLRDDGADRLVVDHVPRRFDPVG